MMTEAVAAVMLCSGREATITSSTMQILIPGGHYGISRTSHRLLFHNR
jgi:hypothetical protein